LGNQETNGGVGAHKKKETELPQRHACAHDCVAAVSDQGDPRKERWREGGKNDNLKGKRKKIVRRLARKKVFQSGGNRLRPPPEGRGFGEAREGGGRGSILKRETERSHDLGKGVPRHEGRTAILDAYHFLPEAVPSKGDEKNNKKKKNKKKKNHHNFSYPINTTPLHRRVFSFHPREKGSTYFRSRSAGHPSLRFREEGRRVGSRVPPQGGDPKNARVFGHFARRGKGSGKTIKLKFFQVFLLLYGRSGRPVFAKKKGSKTEVPSLC